MHIIYFDQIHLLCYSFLCPLHPASLPFSHSLVGFIMLFSYTHNVLQTFTPITLSFPTPPSLFFPYPLKNSTPFTIMPYDFFFLGLGPTYKRKRVIFVFLNLVYLTPSDIPSSIQFSSEWHNIFYETSLILFFKKGHTTQIYTHIHYH
jgi:hypothetical protein